MYQAPHSLCALARMWWKVAATFHYRAASHHCSDDVGSSACILLKGNQFILCKLRPSSIENLSLVGVRKAQSVTADLKMARRCINQACPTPGAMQQMSGIVINSIIHTYCFPPLIRLNSAEANRPLSSEALWMFQREVKRRPIIKSL